MKEIKFESGKTYGNWQTDRSKTVEKRTACYVWLYGKKKQIRHTTIDGESVEYFEYNGDRYYAMCDWAWIQK